MEFVIAALIVGLSALGLAAGLIVMGRPPRTSCGGLTCAGGGRCAGCPRRTDDGTDNA